MDSRKSGKSRLGLFIVPLLALGLLFFGNLDPARPEVTRMAAVAVLMAGWWITEAIPIPATALLPVALFPLFGILKGTETASLYFNHIIFLFIGGFIFALAMQRWDLHRRIALKILIMLGASPQRLVLGFMTATWFLSMWISNTAATMMMLPMAMAIGGQFRERMERETCRKFTVALLLGVAYSASIGGLATLIGTPPNLSMARILHIVFPAAPEISFATWFAFALPLSVTFLVIAWLLLCRLFLEKDQAVCVESGVIEREHREQGPMGFEQRAVLALFLLLVASWMFRADIKLAGFVIPGWSNLFPVASFIDDGTIAIGIALLLFLIPSKSEGGGRLMNWETAVKLKWGIVLLFGGGFALASGFPPGRRRGQADRGFVASLESQPTFVRSLQPCTLPPSRTRAWPIAPLLARSAAPSNCSSPLARAPFESRAMRGARRGSCEGRGNSDRSSIISYSIRATTRPC